MNVQPDVTYDDVGGAGEALEKLREVVELPLLHPERFVTLGIDPPKVRWACLGVCVRAVCVDRGRGAGALVGFSYMFLRGIKCCVKLGTMFVCLRATQFLGSVKPPGLPRALTKAKPRLD